MTPRAPLPPIDWPALLPDVARALLGEPTSRSTREWRYGNKGSLAVHVDGERGGTWRDFEEDEGGGVLALVEHVRRCTRREALDWLRGAGFLPPDGERGPVRPATAFSRSSPGRYPGPHDADARSKAAYARQVWGRTKPIAGTLAEAYLHERGVGLIAGAPALRFDPALSHPLAPGRFPCLVAGVQDVRGGFLGLQRTYLDARDGGGKADVEPTRASLGRLSGGAVRLAEPEAGRPLLLGEGIESTAAAMALFELPGWAALGTAGLRKIELPEDVREVLIAADRDAAGAGQLAAAALAERLEGEGREVEIQLPPFVGDWNDVLMLGREGA